MTIEFYNNLSDFNVINKNITKVSEMTGSLKDECSIETPVITVQNNGPIAANYCYIPEFGKYYYILDQTVVHNNILRLRLKVDVLYSYKTQILALSAIINNSSSDNDKYLSTDLWVSKVKTSTNILNFPTGFNNTGEYILITAGG